jgi:hypothetical protein
MTARSGGEGGVKELGPIMGIEGDSLMFIDVHYYQTGPHELDMRSRHFQRL